MDSDAETKLCEIAEGGYGNVWLMFDRKKREVFARKHVPLSGGCTLDDIKNELRANRKLKHPHLVEAFQFQLKADSGLVIDMEYCELTLHQYIYEINREKLPRIITKLFPCEGTGRTDFQQTQNIRNVWRIMSEITSGISYFHEQKEVHRDLKPRNVLFSCKAGVWKLADLGFTSEGSSGTLHSLLRRGTMAYRSPELAIGGKWNNKVDIWALGCIFYEFIYQQTPSLKHDVHNYFELDLQHREVPLMDRRWMEATAQVIDETLAIQPQARPTATQLCQMFDRLLLQNPNELDCPLGYLHSGESSVAAEDIDAEIRDGFDILSDDEMIDDDESPEPWADRDHGKPPCMQRKECEHCNQTFHGNQGRERHIMAHHFPGKRVDIPNPPHCPRCNTNCKRGLATEIHVLTFHDKVQPVKNVAKRRTQKKKFQYR